MSVAEVSALPYEIEWNREDSRESETPSLRDRVCAASFRIASYLTDPVCKAHEYFRRLHAAIALGSTSNKMKALGEKFFFGAAILGFALLATVTTLPGIALRGIAAHLQKVPYLHFPGESAAKTLPADGTFSLLSWNICCVGAGYTITDGGVFPWCDRIEAIERRILDADADVNCIYETMDAKSGFRLAETLRSHGYNLYFNICPQAVGVSSGILVASKYKTENPEFTRFPMDSLVGRTKRAAKGVFSFDLTSQGRAFGKIFATHLQHSEEPEFPTAEEIAGRKKQMEIILEKIDRVNDRCVVLTGDLNLDDQEYQASSWKERFAKGDEFQEKTWGGDAFCTSLVGKRPSSALNLDHTMVVRGTALALSTSLLETGYDPKVFQQKALSNHAGLFSRITIDGSPPSS